MNILEKDYKYKQSCGEMELLPYVQQGIKQLKIQSNHLKEVGELKKQKSENNNNP